MILFPGSKINLGLHIISKRPDGYHTLDTCFFPLQWSDVLEIHLDHPSPGFKTTGLAIQGNVQDNLIYKAFQFFPDIDISKAYIHIHKLVPMGAGLGGGSADAAATLVYLNEQTGYPYTLEQLQQYAAQLGADCAFFLQKKPMRAYGIGYELEEILLNIPENLYILVIWPNISISTKEAYSGVVPTGEKTSTIPDILRKNITNWKVLLENDFEKSIYTTYPEIAHWKKFLYDRGAIYASMSGSGAAVYGIFEFDPTEVATYFPKNFFYYKGSFTY